MRRSAAPSARNSGLGASTNAQHGFLAPRARAPVAAAAKDEAERAGGDVENVNVDVVDAPSTATTTTAVPPLPLQQQPQQQRASQFAAPGLLERKAFKAPSTLPGGGAGAGTTSSAIATAAATAAAAGPSTSSSSESQFYKVLYCKRSNKKRINKSFSDAYLEVKQQQQCGSGDNVVLYNDEGKRIASGKLKGARDMPEGAEGEVGHWEFEVCERVDAAAFLSGSLFLKPVAAGLLSSSTTTAEAATTEATTTTNNSIARLAFRPHGASGLGMRRGGAGGAGATTTLPPPLHDPFAPGAIVLNASAAASGQVPVVVDPFLARKLRPHQVEAIRWMYDRIALPPILASSSMMAAMKKGGGGSNDDSGGVGSISAAAASAATAANRAGCILSHEPGLGKTLSSLTLVHTLLRQSPRGKGGLIRRVAVACPASLCDNWAAEVHKWLGSERLRCVVLRGSGADAASDAAAFKAGTATPLLIASYETLRAASATLAGSIDLLICDEGHRLKAAGGSRTQAALLALRSPRMLLMTGTPLQNDLSELFALVDFACPGALGTLRLFQSLFEVPIRKSRDARASEREREIGQQRAAELASRVASIVLRRSAAVNAAYLPPLTVYDVFLKLTDTQVSAYRGVLRGKGVASVLGGGGTVGGAGTTTVLPLIGLLRKICISPELVSIAQRGGEAAAAAAKNDSDSDKGAARAAAASAAAASWRDSCKLVALDALLRAASARGDKVIVTSTSTAVLDVAGLVALNAGLTTARIDGATDARSRLDVVDAFNRDGGNAKRSLPSPSTTTTTSCVPGSRGGDVMLLSMRAGGAGLNLVGANVLVTLDFDWNPATIAQAEARHWRSGQAKPCSVFRLIATGTIDEKMLQRVLSKKDLAGALKADGGGGGGSVAAAASKKKNSCSAFTREELRELFSLDSKTRCGTREIMLKQAKKKANERFGGGGGGGAKKRLKRTVMDDDDEGEGNPAAAPVTGEEEDNASSWLLPAVACVPGDAEAGAPELLVVDPNASTSVAVDGEAAAAAATGDGSKRILAAVVATGAVSWVHEEDGKAAVASEGEGEEGGKVGGGHGGAAAATEVKVEEEEEEEEEEDAAAPAENNNDDVEAAAAPAAAADDVSSLELMD